MGLCRPCGSGLGVMLVVGIGEGLGLGFLGIVAAVGIAGGWGFVVGIAVHVQAVTGTSLMEQLFLLTLPCILTKTLV